MNDQINVTGLDLWELLAALHNGATTPRTVVCTMQARGDITAEEAREEAQAGVRDDFRTVNGVPFWADYLFGRPIKAFLKLDPASGEVFLARADLYDRDSGQGAAQKVVDSLRARRLI